MFDFASLLQHSNAWLFVPGAMLLGALHGLEPGHSKTMMAAFIVAIRGSVKQAVLLGLAATFSHTLIVWLVALGGTWISSRFTAAVAEPWLELISALVIMAIAAWIAWHNWRQERSWRLQQDLRRQTNNNTGLQVVDTGHGLVEISLTQQQGENCWQLRSLSGRPWQADEVILTTDPDEKSAHQFDFANVGSFLRSTQSTGPQQPSAARLTLSHAGHAHDYDLQFGPQNIAVEAAVFQDAHELAHARQIEKRFQGQAVTNGQILLFGLTGGLIPCPAAVTVLLICLQMKALALGSALVLCFSIGLALTMVAVGVAAALSVDQLARRWNGFDTLARRAPWLSSLLMLAIAGFMAWHGWQGLSHQLIT
ncbi:High-affinity nickel-transport protein [Izhakiella capsodis]|uniref:Nickel/cobalt efflux system n=1 Tax=Izhakiella capsodis TaxID=1367852 RepID=A0A1I4VZ97_9GAMM|nr:nickel/cobalt efflux transporter [Izhakiella capsodis]SFN06490.1 High-affinity nickel-transport protein [Izhakiella capsodis]